MTAFNFNPNLCFKCKLKKAKYVMQDVEITKGKWKGFCESCYFSLFKKEKK